MASLWSCNVAAKVTIDRRKRERKSARFTLPFCFTARKHGALPELQKKSGECTMTSKAEVPSLQPSVIFISSGIKVTFSIMGFIPVYLQEHIKSFTPQGAVSLSLYQYCACILRHTNTHMHTHAHAKQNWILRANTKACILPGCSLSTFKNKYITGPSSFVFLKKISSRTLYQSHFKQTNKKKGLFIGFLIWNGLGTEQ